MKLVEMGYHWVVIILFILFGVIIGIISKFMFFIYFEFLGDAQFELKGGMPYRCFVSQSSRGDYCIFGFKGEYSND